MTNLLRDARFGFRLLRKNPGFAAVAILALALGIAANTAIFSVIYATYLEPLPYRDADRLVMVWSRQEANRNMVAALDYLDWKRQATVFEDMEAWSAGDVNLATDGPPEHIRAGPATPGFLGMLGYGHPLALGRSFIEEEGIPGKDEVVVLSHRLWQQRFGGDGDIMGRQVRIDGKPHTVVGVLGAGPADQNMNRLWLPLALTPERLQRDPRWVLVMGRLKPGVTIEQANADMARVVRNVAATRPDANAGWTASVEPFRNNFVSDETKTALWLLVGAVAFVLLIACANVANLMLARGTARQRELAVRASLGASRAAILRQLITESVVLALVGGAVGVGLAYGLVGVIMALLPPFTLPTEVDVRLNVPVLLFSLAACALSGILFGCAPAWQATRADLNDALKETGRALSGGRHSLRRALVVLEFGLALALLTGGGLAIHSFFKVASVDLGLRTDRLLTFSVPVVRGRLAGPERINAFYDELLDRVRAVPGVVSASVSTALHLRGGGFGLPFTIAGKPVPEPSQRPVTGFNPVSLQYFETLGIRLTRGRAFNAQDVAGGLPVAVVNEAFVQRYLADVDPLTQRIVVGQMVQGAPMPGPPREWQIVGVSADVRNDGPKNESFPLMEVPFSQSPWPSTWMAVRPSGDPATVQSSIAAVIRSMDPDLPMGNVKTMEQVVGEQMAGDRFNMALFASFAAVALLLAAVGIYGVMVFVVARRTRDIGLRMALGATRGRVLGQVLREGMATALVGTVLGSAGAYFVARAMRGILYGIGLMDPTVFVAVALTLLGAALAACLAPALRAASVDPMVALRHE